MTGNERKSTERNKPRCTPIGTEKICAGPLICTTNIAFLPVPRRFCASGSAVFVLFVLPTSRICAGQKDFLTISWFPHILPSYRRPESRKSAQSGLGMSRLKSPAARTSTDNNGIGQKNGGQKNVHGRASMATISAPKIKRGRIGVPIHNPLPADESEVRTRLPNGKPSGAGP